MKWRDAVYEERLISKLNAGIFFIMGIFFLYLSAYSFQKYTLTVTLAIGAVLVIIIFFGINFSVMRVIIHQEYLEVSFGIFRKFFVWKSIESCRIDDRHGMKYGGWGIRFARINGMPVMAYIIENAPRVVIVLKDHRYREFVFSTRNPDRVIKLIMRRIEPGK